MTLIYPTASQAAHPAHLSPAYRSSIKRALATMCVGVGQGVAMAIERLN